MGIVIEFADIRDATWWSSGPTVRWTAERHPELPVIEATGTILLMDEDDDAAEDPTIEVGTIRIAKPFLWAGMDPWMAMDDISSDYAALASSVLADGNYDERFEDWFLETFGVMPSGDPIFIDDVYIRPEHRRPLDPIAAHAVIEAVAAFGSPDSAIIGYGLDLVAADKREHYQERGLWDWVEPLGARPWRDVLAAARPQG